MFQESEKEWILEAINHLKHRKARPDLSRICLRMKRKHQMTFAQTKKLMESLIEGGIVVKAVYKNNTSYRDVSKWKKGRLGGQILNSDRMLKRFIRAIRETETTKGTGVSAQAIEAYLGSKVEEKCFLSGAALRDALENEIANGFLDKTEQGNQISYSVNEENVKNISQLYQLENLDLDNLENLDGDLDPDLEENLDLMADEDDGSGVVLSSVSHQANVFQDILMKKIVIAIIETKHTEPGATFEGIKQFISEDDKEVTDSQIAIQLDKCISKGSIYKLAGLKGAATLYAVRDENSGDNSRAITSQDTLLQINKEQNEHLTDNACVPSANFPVTISRLQTPPISNASNIGDKISVLPMRPLSKRKRVIKSHGPDFETEMPTRVKSKSTESAESVYPTPTDSPVSEKSETAVEQSFKSEVRKKRGRPKKEQSSVSREGDTATAEDDSYKQGGCSEQSSVYNDEAEDADSIFASMYPDVSTWTTQQVADYFTEKGYKEEATSMMENDIDGLALGLLKRTDIVGPPLGGMLKIKKLGVALKLFRDIRDLLYQGNADNYVDPYEERAFYRS